MSTLLHKFPINRIYKITNFLFDSGSLDPGTAMILVNAVYFKGQWKEKFDPSRTYETFFMIDKQTHKKVPTMHQTVDNVLYGELPDLMAKFVEIPYLVITITFDNINF